MRIFVAGATGVIGRRLVPLLVSAGHEVTGMTRSPERAEALRASGAAAVVCDAFDRDGVVAAVAAARPEVVIHQLTDIPPALNMRRYEREMEGNDRLRREGTRNLVDGALAAGSRRVVAQSIAFLYAPSGDAVKTEEAPLYLDAQHGFRRSVEALQELERLVLETEGIEGVVLRYGFFYGPGTAFAPDGPIAATVRKRGFPIVGDGGGVFSFVHVDDAARATVLAVERGRPGAYNVVDDDPAAVREWLPVYAASLSAKPPRRVPKVVARLAAGAYGVDLMTRFRGASNEKAKRELGWEPEYRTWRTGFYEAARAAK